MSQTAPVAEPVQRLAALIREHRTRRELTQADVADAVGVNQTAVAFWEAGKYRPAPKHVKPLAAALGLPPLVLWDAYIEDAA